MLCCESYCCWSSYYCCCWQMFFLCLGGRRVCDGRCGCGKFGGGVGVWDGVGCGEGWFVEIGGGIFQNFPNNIPWCTHTFFESKPREWVTYTQNCLSCSGTLRLLIVGGGIKFQILEKLHPYFNLLDAQIMKFVLDFLKSTKYGPNSFIFMRFGAYFPYFFVKMSPCFNLLSPPI